jgi:Flp pilus assembly protein TadD
MSALSRIGVMCIAAAGLIAPSARADDAEVHYRMCMNHKKAGKTEEAERQCSLAIAARPSHAAAHYTLATLQRARGTLVVALDSFRKVRELEPQNALGWAGEGAVLLRLDRNEEAVTALKQAVALDPSDTVSAGNLGSALRKQGHSDEAIRVYQKALEKAPEDPDLLNNLAVALRTQNRNAEAIEVLKRALVKRPHDPALTGNLAKTLRAEKRYADAIGPYEDALKANDRDAGLWFDLAYSYEQTGQNDKALAAYRRHLELIRKKDARAAAYVEDVIEKLQRK